ncbi:unnamed protein product, partial [Ectocarpus fasciculatus]
FYILSLPALPSACNQAGLGLNDILSGDFTSVLLMNYMFDFRWLLDTCPQLRDPSVLVCCLHGEKNDAQKDKLQFIVEEELYNWTCSEVELGAERFGTHHSKAAILFYPDGIRVAIMTANYVESDFMCRTQGLFVQDFPKKTSTSTGTVPFENDLISYLEQVRVKSPDTAATFSSAICKIQLYDFSSAEVVLVGSVPGRHSSKDAKWGHLKLAASVRKAQATSLSEDAPSPQKSKLLMQYSSMGSMGLNGKYLKELAESLYGGPCPDLQLVWPAVSCVRNSLQGYMSGGSLPCKADILYDNVNTRALKSCFCGRIYQWCGTPDGRHMATPHMKCYFKYKSSSESKEPAWNQIEWFLLTSMNLSQAAWGVLQGNGSKLYIKSYELGVLFLPSLMKQKSRSFSCTPSHPKLGIVRGGCVSDSNSSAVRNLNTLGDTGVYLDIPFTVPPPPYTSSDIPWTWDTPHWQADRLGNVWNPSG